MTSLFGAVLGSLAAESAVVGPMGYLIDLAVTAPHGAELVRTLMRPRHVATPFVWLGLR